MTRHRTKITGSLNSKNPNPFELAYKEVFDKLPRWRQVAIAEDRAEGKDTSVTQDFVKEVARVAEEKYAALDK